MMIDDDATVYSTCHEKLTGAQISLLSGIKRLTILAATQSTRPRGSRVEISRAHGMGYNWVLAMGRTRDPFGYYHESGR